MSSRHAKALIVLLGLMAACKKDSTGPGAQRPDFPVLPAQLLANLCVRGERASGEAIAGAVEATDCDYGDGSFFEVWRVRVLENGAYRFEASSTFDNLLSIYRLDSIVGGTPYLTFIMGDDDTGPGVNALLQGVGLLTDTDYFLLVNGYDAASIGPYTVAFTQP